jgi:hypothetical protein
MGGRGFSVNGDEKNEGKGGRTGDELVSELQSEGAKSTRTEREGDARMSASEPGERKLKGSGTAQSQGKGLTLDW